MGATLSEASDGFRFQTNLTLARCGRTVTPGYVKQKEAIEKIDGALQP